MRLVEQDQLRRERHHLGDLEQTPLPLRQARGWDVGQLCQPGELEDLARPLLVRGADPQSEPLAVNDDENGFEHGHAAEQPRVLERSTHAEISEALRRQAVTFRPRNSIEPALGR